MPKNRVRATDTVLPVLTRRAALAAPLALLPRNTSARTESEILRLFREYERLRELHKIAWQTVDEAAEDRIYDRMIAVEDEILSLPSTSAADFAAKVILDTARANLFSDWETGKLWIEARELTGCGLR